MMPAVEIGTQVTEAGTGPGGAEIQVAMEVGTMTSPSVVWDWLTTSSVKPTQFFCKWPLLSALLGILVWSGMD